MSHCETCECDNPSALSTFNLRCRRLIANGEVGLSVPISSALEARISRVPPFDLGFREFMPSYSTAILGGLFLCGIAPGPRPDDVPVDEQPTCSTCSGTGLGRNVQVGGVEHQLGCRVCSSTGKISPLTEWRRHHRFFSVVIPSPPLADDLSRCIPKPVEYLPGDAFDMVDALRGESLIELALWPDKLVARWLRQSRDTLHRFVEAALVS